MTAPAALRPRGRGPAWIAAGAGLLGLGVLLGLIGLFPSYVGTQSLAAQTEQLVPHLLYLLTWAVSAVLVAGGLRARSGGARIGALLGAGLSAVTFGLFFADLGQVIASGGLGAGLVLSLLGWLACAAGSVVALIAPSRATAVPGSAGPGGPPARGGLSRPRATDAGPIALLLLAAVGTVAAFVPSWDTYTLTQASTGASQTVTAGNAFASPAPVIAGNVAVIVAVVVVALLAALWRPARQGAALLAGATLPLAAQAISALIQAGEPATPAMFGISQSQAQAAGLTISSGLTPIFWVYCVFVISLLISCAWMLTAPQYHAMPATPPHPAPGHVPPAQNVATGGAGDSGAGAGDSGAEARDSEAEARDSGAEARDTGAGDSGAEARDSGAGTGDNKASDARDSNGGEDHEESTYA
jgi:ABC-type transport system involved in multi-copper enzyme maturation permease subunit